MSAYAVPSLKPAPFANHERKLAWSMLVELKNAPLAKTSCSVELNNLVGMSML